MIDERTFRDTWALLSERFNRQLSTPLMMAYYHSLSARMSTAQFKAAAQVVFETREFFPRPADFLEAGQPSAEAEVLEQWELVQELMRGFGNRAALSEEARRVVGLLGGETKLRNTQLDAVQYVRRDFLELYGNAVQIARREGGERIAPTPESLRLTEAIMNGEAAP